VTNNLISTYFDTNEEFLSSSIKLCISMKYTLIRIDTLMYASCPSLKYIWIGTHKWLYTCKDKNK